MPIQKKSWALTKEAFDSLLAKLDSDQERAGEKYELVRAQLIKFFEWRCCPSSQELADETINRVARKITEGEEIPQERFNAYCCGVARNVLREYRRNPDSLASTIDSLSPSHHPSLNPEYLTERDSERSSLERRLLCLEFCIGKLPPETREMFYSYYISEQRARIESRRQLAETLHIPLNNLRIRIHRVRERLEKCLSDCIKRSPV